MLVKLPGEHGLQIPGGWKCTIMILSQLPRSKRQQ